MKPAAPAQSDGIIDSPLRRGPGAALIRWGGTFHLAGLPELKLFPDERSRLTALDEITWGRIGGWKGFLSNPVVLSIFSAFVTALVMLQRPSQRVFGLSPSMAVLADVVMLVVVIGGVFIFWHRPVAAGHLRRRLIDAGVPVCRGCGYDLRGLREAGECPECGRGIDAAVRALLTAPGAS